MAEFHEKYKTYRNLSKALTRKLQLELSGPNWQSELKCLPEAILFQQYINNLSE